VLKKQTCPPIHVVNLIIYRDIIRPYAFGFISEGRRRFDFAESFDGNNPVILPKHLFELWVKFPASRFF